MPFSHRIQRGEPLELTDKLEGNVFVLLKVVSHALAGRQFRGRSRVFLAFILRSTDHTTRLGNVYEQSRSFDILEFCSEAVISHICLIDVNVRERQIFTPILPRHGIPGTW